ncbi:hypothetical protein Tco_1366084, partial [Tanacetum coccineum]
MPLGDHAAHWSNLLGEIVREFPMHYPSWRNIEPERKAGVIGNIRDNGELRDSRVPVLIQTYFDTHTVDDVFLRDEERLLYMLRLKDLGPNTPSGVPYTDDEIMAMVHRGKQWGHIPGVDRVLAGQGRDVLAIPEPRCTHTAYVDE